MDIVFVVSHYYPYIGGVEYVVKSVAERLVKQGHEVIVIAGEPSIDTPKEEEINKVRIVRWPARAPSNAYHIPRKRSRLAEILRNLATKADVVHFHSIHSIFTIYCMKAIKDPGVRKVLTPHYHGTGHTAFRRLLWVFWRSYIGKLLGSQNNLVIHTVSNYEAELFRQHYRVDTVTIEHGVEEWIPSIKWRPDNYVLYAGRIEKYKNIHRLANIVHILNRNFDMNLRLVVIGDGSYRKHLEKLLEKKCVDHEILPFQHYEKYIEYLSHARFYGLLSQREAYGQTVNEANAIGVPVVIAKPWGLNFANRRRTLIVNLSKHDYSIAPQAKEFLDNVEKEPRCNVPSWSEVVEMYVSRLYK